MRCSHLSASFAKRIRREIREIRDQIIYEIAFIESALDDPEHISLDRCREKLSALVPFPMKKKLEKLVRSSSRADISNSQRSVGTVVILGSQIRRKSSFDERFSQ